MKPDFPPPPQPDLNSSSLAYLNHHPPGTQPHYHPAGTNNLITLGNRPAPDRVLPNPQQGLVGTDAATDTHGPARDASPDHEPGSGLEHARPDTSDTEVLEHSEPVYTQRRTEPPKLTREGPVTTSVLLSPEAMKAELLQAVTEGNIGRLRSLLHQADKFCLPKPESVTILCEAAKHGQLHIMKWLAEQGCDIQEKNEENDDALTLAASNGHLEVVQWLVEKGCNIQYRHGEYRNALGYAARRGHLEVVKWLFNKGCDVNHINGEGDNALMLAASYGHLDIVKWLADYGCDVDDVSLLENNALTLAASHGHLDVVKWLFDKGCDVRHVTSWKDNALNLAARGGHLKLVQWLADHGCDVQQVNEYGQNALTLAAKRGYLELVQWLADHGCDVNQVEPSRDNALTLAASGGHLELAQWLIEKDCNVNQVGPFGDNALALAASGGHLELVQLLIEKDCNVNQVGIFGNNALTLAARGGHLDVVKCLADHGCEVGQIDNSKDNALTLAAEGGHLDVVKWLADHGCNVHQINESKNNALTLAAKGGHLDVVEWLADHECDVDQINESKDNALTLAAKRGHLDVVKWLADDGCDIHQINSSNNNILICAIRKGNLDLVQYLVGKGCKVNHINKFNQTALSLAFDFKKIDIACYLITQGANVNIGFRPESDGFLFEAIKIGNAALVQLLIPLHDLSKRSKKGRTPLMVATEKNLVEIAIPLIFFTALLPSARKLLDEALKNTTSPLLKELLRNPNLIVNNSSSFYSHFREDGTFGTPSAFIYEHLLSQLGQLSHLETSLGSDGVITPMQRKSAAISVYADMPTRKLNYPDEFLFHEKLPPYLSAIRDNASAFVNDNIEVLATHALQWEEDHLVPVVENLFEGCLNHSLSENPTLDILGDLTAKGLYHPIAQKIATAWTSAWATVSEEAAPMLKPTGATQIHIDRFVNTPVGSGLLQAFRAALRRELDSVGGGILRIEGANLSEESKALYADLIGRQLHLIAQFWRAES